MSKLTLLNIETLGVDLRSNPLLIGSKKLHAATNLVFEEGRIQTRSGVRYKSLGCSGQFQGASEFFPKRGISTETFSDSAGGVAVAVSGKLYLNCKVVEGVELPSTGDVNLFQAENYLIIQNEAASTYWWDGVNPPVESPGMQEQDWSEVETPIYEAEIVAPVATIPTCEVENAAAGGVSVTFRIRSADGGAPVVGALVSIYKKTKRATKGITGANGNVLLKASPGTYFYTVTRNGFTPVERTSFNANVTPTLHDWDECTPPTIVVSGQTTIDVSLAPIPGIPCGEPSGGCFVASTSLIAVAGDAFVKRGQLTLTNNSNCPRSIDSIDFGTGNDLALGAGVLATPEIVPPGESRTYVVFSTKSIDRAPFTVGTECESLPWVFLSNDPPCAGPWGSGHDSHPDTVTIYDHVEGHPETLPRVSKCVWFYGYILRYGTSINPNIWYLESPANAGYKPGTFADGPLGNYYDNSDGTGALEYTVT